MGRKPTVLIHRPLTGAEREARRRQRKADEEAENRAAWRRVLAAKTIREAREIAREVLGETDSE